jgi:hypothetical protein
MQNAAVATGDGNPQPQQGFTVANNPLASEASGASGAAQAAEMQQVIALLMTAIGSMQRGCDGYQFAESVIVLNGDMEYENIVAQIKEMTVPVVVSLAKGAPQIGEIVGRYEKQFTAFLSEFIEGPDTEEDADQVDGLDRGAAKSAAVS